MKIFLTLILNFIGFNIAHVNLNQSKYNVGWDKFLEDEPTEFHNLPLRWEIEDSEVPSWIKGSYVKNGPAQHRFGSEERWYSHYMDSWGKLNKITFTDDGQVLYSGRMIESETYKKCVEKQKLSPSITVGPVEPNDWTMEEYMHVGLFDNTNVILWRLGAENPKNATYIATTDYPLVHTIDPESLAVTGRHSWLNPLDGMSMMTASHWRREIGSDSSLNFHQIMDPLHPMHPNLVLFRFGSTLDEQEEVSRFSVDHTSYIHMMTNTPKYAVIILYPVTMNLLVLPLHNLHPLETLEQVDGPCKIKLVNLVNGDVLSFETEDPSMVFATHIANAWEEGEEEVVFDLATNPWDAMAEYLDRDTMLHHPHTESDLAGQVMKRVRLIMSTGETIVEEFPNLGGEPWMNTFDFPTINDNYSGYKNRYVYGWVTVDYWRNTLIKRDTENSNGDKSWFKPSHYPGEMFFIPNPNGVEEDDGVLITMSFDGMREQSYVMLLDAKTFTEINHAYLPYNVPFSFHGNWFPELY